MNRPTDLNPFKGWDRTDFYLLGGAGLALWLMLRPRHIIADVVGGAVDTVRNVIIEPGQQATERALETRRANTLTVGANAAGRSAALGATWQEENRAPLVAALWELESTSAGPLSRSDLTWIQNLKRWVAAGSATWTLFGGREQPRLSSSGNLLSTADVSRLATLSRGLGDVAAQSRAAVASSTQRGMAGAEWEVAPDGTIVVLTPVRPEGGLDKGPLATLPARRAASTKAKARRRSALWILGLGGVGAFVYAKS